jgi:5'-nucleotidase
MTHTAMNVINRRHFIQRAGAGAAGLILAPHVSLASSARRIVILHTNDTHSRIDPFPEDGGRFAGLGGAARRASLVRDIRRRNPNALLLDSGDIFQGTPYFNFFGGEIEFKTMSSMRYDVATLGNHDFDNGVNHLAEMMPHADFEFVSANYDVEGTSLVQHVNPFTIREVDGVKIGIFGLGIDFSGLVMPALHEGVSYLDPAIVAKSTVDALRGQGCHLVVCLSHLGHRYNRDQVSDTSLASEVAGIDVILGGHTHTFLDEPEVVASPGGWTTLINQVGFAGIRLGRIDITVDAEGRPRSYSSRCYGISAGIA